MSDQPDLIGLKMGESARIFMQKGKVRYEQDTKEEWRIFV